MGSRWCGHAPLPLYDLRQRGRVASSAAAVLVPLLRHVARAHRVQFRPVVSALCPSRCFLLPAATRKIINTIPRPHGTAWSRATVLGRAGGF